MRVPLRECKSALPAILHFCTSPPWRIGRRLALIGALVPAHGGGRGLEQAARRKRRQPVARNAGVQEFRCLFEGETPGPSKRQAKAGMAKDWSSLQEEIQQLYCVDKKPLREVMRIVKGRHGFQASLRSYRTQIKKWGYTKYSSQSHPTPPGHTRQILSESQPHLGGDGAHLVIEGTQTLGSRAAGHFPFEQSQNESNTTYNVHDFVSGAISTNHDPTASGAPGLRTEGEIPRGLFQALQRGDLDATKRLLQSGVPVNNVDQLGYSPLYYAVRASMPEIAMELIRFGADVHFKDLFGRPLLHVAVGALLLNLGPEGGSQKVLDALILGGADPSVQDASGSTPLHVLMYAISSREDAGWPERARGAVDALLGHSTVASDDGLTPFDILMGKKRYCHDTFCYLDRFFSADTRAVTPTTHQQQKFSKFLRRASEHRSWNGECDYYCENVICHFIRQGADPHTTLPSGEMLSRRFLRQADQNCGVVVAELCNVLDPHMSWEDGNTILHELCSPNDGRPVGRNRIVSSMKKAVEAGASLNARNKRGETPLLLIFLAKDRAKDFIHAVDLLLDSGADPFLQDTSGNCPLVLAGKIKSVPDFTRWLRLDLQRRDERANEGNQLENKEASGPGGRFYWKEWELSVEAKDWSVARKVAFYDTAAGSYDVCPQLRRDALFVLAERFVERLCVTDDGDVSPGAREVCRKTLVTILRDCREKNSQLPEAWVDKLLELS